MKYIIGVDIGIGSLGWAVIIIDGKTIRIRDFGVRIFDSGEIKKGEQKRESQARRIKRATRRLERRRSHRKWRIKAHLENIGFTTIKKIEEYFETCNPDIISLRVRALEEKLSPEEVAACLINICNKRGYKEFYETDFEDLPADEAEELSALNKTRQLMATPKYRTVAEMILHDPLFKNEGSQFRKYRNSSFNAEKILFSREDK